MSDVVDKVLGISGGISAVLAYIFYKYYRGKREFARQVKKIPVLQPDDSLYDRLNGVENGFLAYAVVEGVVKDLGRTLSSHHSSAEGVMRRTQIVEHKSKRINGFWSESKKELRDNLQTAPFALLKMEGGDAQFKVELVDPQTASHIQPEMDITYDRFEPHKSNIVEIGLDRLFGEVTKGVQDTESMLINGTSVLALGRVFLERGKAKLGPPFQDNYEYIITKMSLGELVKSYESQSKTFKILSIVSALLGGGLLFYLFWRNLKKWLKQRQQRAEFENIRRALQSQDTGAAEGNTDSDGDRENSCVICLSEIRQVIALPCGHISCCLGCAEILPNPKKCPICRASVQQFTQAYFA